VKHTSPERQVVRASAAQTPGMDGRCAFAAEAANAIAKTAPHRALTPIHARFIAAPLCLLPFNPAQ
jgi:hypothetical protein